MNIPKVSLVISTYNWPKALRLVLLSVLEQKVKPYEIVIADDGSREDTRQLIEEFQSKTVIPIHHVWHEDDGFRKTSILNKAIAKADGDYIIELDGDIVIDPSFIKDHLELAEKGFFVSGSRVVLTERMTRKMIEKSQRKPDLTGMTLGHMLNNIRFRLLRIYWAKKRYKKHTSGIRGCNLAFWKSDFIAVNGYNEDMTGWGHEETELGLRLFFKGVERKRLKMGGVCYHLWHKLNSKHNELYNLQIVDKTIKQKSVYTENGIGKYLQ